MFDFSQLNRLRNDLNRAIVENDLELFSRLVKAPDAKEDQEASGPRLHNLNYLDSDGQTPLHRTCHRGNLEFVKLLVESGANQHIQNRDGWYPVHIASYYGHSEIAKYLLSEENFANTPKIDVFEAEVATKKRNRDQYDPGIPAARCDTPKNSARESALKRAKVEDDENDDDDDDSEDSDDTDYEDSDDSFESSEENASCFDLERSRADDALIDSGDFLDSDIYLGGQVLDCDLDALDNLDLEALE